MTTKAELTERKLKALQLRRSGVGYDEIAAKLGCSIRSAFSYARDGLAEYGELCAESDQQIRMNDLMILDSLLPAVIANARAGDTKAVHSVLEILERRSKYLGFDAVKKQEIRQTGETTATVVIHEGDLALL